MKKPFMMAEQFGPLQEDRDYSVCVLFIGGKRWCRYAMYRIPETGEVLVLQGPNKFQITEVQVSMSAKDDWDYILYVESGGL
jgi:hypothetical protein